jgi:hypothetical protein
LWFCLNGDSQELAVDGGTYTWDVAACCVSCTTATLEIRVRCFGGGISFQWFYICDGGTPEIAVAFVDYCNASTFEVVTIDASCFLQMQVTTLNIGCDACGITTDCCDPVPIDLTLTIVGGIYAGTYNMSYGAGEWVNDTGAFSCRLECDGTPQWVVTFELDTYTTLTNTCNPLSLDFDVSGTAYGITSLTIVE